MAAYENNVYAKIITTQETRVNITRSKTSLKRVRVVSVIDRNSLAAQETFLLKVSPVFYHKIHWSVKFQSGP